MRRRGDAEIEAEEIGEEPSAEAKPEKIMAPSKGKRRIKIRAEHRFKALGQERDGSKRR